MSRRSRSRWRRPLRLQKEKEVADEEEREERKKVPRKNLRMQRRKKKEKMPKKLRMRRKMKREFLALLLEVDSTYSGLLMYNNVRWLSRGKVLERFVECFEEIKERVPDPRSSSRLKRPALLRLALQKMLVAELGVTDCVAAGTSFPPAAVFLWPPARSERLPIGVPLGVADRAGGRCSDRRVARGKLLLAENWCQQPGEGKVYCTKLRATVS
ncbi:hypothetical protein QTO34_018374 [Cnephaeus nilssonii]|uniref:Uncharacterized protein n=1 Tax=Cnephaeus nilssonii TaxID=3371016 RepID=A0AA40HYQ9_CNENI|nr:hypothetical protein QTO34_018374 [Eptesicus nilssonii]